MIRARQKLGKYQIERKLGEGGFASVFRAFDTVEGTQVALKVPHPQFVNKETLEDFRHEIRLMAMLQHPNILGVRNADLMDGHLVVAFPLRERTLADRLQNRISTSLALEFNEQILVSTRRTLHLEFTCQVLRIIWQATPGCAAWIKSRRAARQSQGKSHTNSHARNRESPFGGLQRDRIELQGCWGNQSRAQKTFVFRFGLV